MIAEGLAKSYGEVRALRGVSFRLHAGEVLGFLGPNGAGKTTAIKILTGSLAADEGSAMVCGFDIEEQAIEARASIGYLPENNPLYPEMRVDAFLRFAFDAQAARSDGRESRSQALERVVAATGLEAVFRRAIGNCSKGYRQRVGLAQALLHDPPLLILDEPTNGLDPLQVVEMRELIRQLGSTKTVVLTSHVLPEVEALADRVVLIHQGQKVADAPLAELASDRLGSRLTVTARATTEQLRAICAQWAGVEKMDIRAGAFGDPGLARAQLRTVELDLAAVQDLADALQRAGLTVLEFSPAAGGLEALFRGLDRVPMVATEGSA